MAVDERAYRLPEPVDQAGHEKEAECPTQKAREYENRKIDREDAGRDREHFIRDRRQSSEEDSQKSGEEKGEVDDLNTGFID